MKEQLYELLLLQEIDGEIVREEEKQKRLPSRIREIEEGIDGIERKQQGSKENLKELQVKIKRKEIDAKAINTKIDQHQDELYGGKINDIKELKQLQQVIESMKKDRDKVEESLLVLMDEEDTLKSELNAIDQELVRLNRRLEHIKEEVRKQEEEINRRIEEKNKQRSEIAAKINNRDLMERYDMLWNAKEGRVVVEIDSPTCGGCNLSLPSDIIYHLQRDDLLITCPNCNRILIWKE